MKLTEDDIDYYDIEGHAGVWIGWDYRLGVDEKVGMEWAKQLKQQILKNQEIVESIKQGNKRWQLAEIEYILGNE